MRGSVRVLAVLLPLVSGSLADVLARAAGDEIIERVLKVVAGELITQSDLRAAQEFGLVPTAGENNEREALSRLVDRTLMLAEVERYAPPDPSAQAVDAALTAARERFASADRYRAALERVGWDEAQVREALRQNLRIQAYLNQRFAADSAERQQALIDEWLAGLRRRAEIIDLYAIR